MDIFDSVIEYLEMGDLAREMRDSLAYRLVAPNVDLPERSHQAFSHALSHLGHMREGFACSLRASDVVRLSELHDLVKAFLFEWRRAEELFDVEFMPSGQIELPRAQLLAFTHSYITFATIPQLPPDEVTFPQVRRSYADIHAPRTPGEVLERIEEMEEVVTDMENTSPRQVDRNGLRRTYSFFETSAWLVTYHAARFARKRK